MTFKHKLSRRLALLRYVLLLGLGVASACDLQQLLGLVQSLVVSLSVRPGGRRGLVCAAGGVPDGSPMSAGRGGGGGGAARAAVGHRPVVSVTVSPAAPSVTVGGTVQLAATPLDASGTPLSGRVVTWATSSAAVATVGS